MLSFYSSQNTLLLSDVIIKNITYTEHDVIYQIEMIKKTHICPCCHSKTNYIHDYRLQKIKDLSSFGHNVILHLRKRRYICKACNKRFYEKNDFLSRYQRHTKRLLFEVLKQLTTCHSFKSIASLFNLSITTVMRWFDQLSYQPTELPSVIGIDEFKGNTGTDKYQCIITDIANRKIIDILPTRYKTDLESYFLSRDTSKTTLFVSDMWSTYREISKELFSHATYVIDKYHYIRQVLWAFEAVRKEVQKVFSDYRRKYFKRSKSLLIKRFDTLTDNQKRQVNHMLYTSDRLTNAYILKEDFYTFIDSANSNTARPLLMSWVNRASQSNLERFEKCAQTMVHWQTGILNSFDTPYTNGYTEGMNNKIKVLKRNAYGYRNFNRFRNRILHMCN